MNEKGSLHYILRGYDQHMSSPLRIEYEGAFYHMINRGKGRLLIFPETHYYQVRAKPIRWQ